MSTLFYVSYAALWLLLLTIGVLVLLLYRHFGVMSLGTLEGVQRDGLPIGSVAPPISGVTAAGQDTSWQPTTRPAPAPPLRRPRLRAVRHRPPPRRAVGAGGERRPRDRGGRARAEGRSGPVRRALPSVLSLPGRGRQRRLYALPGARHPVRVRRRRRRPRSCERALRRSGPAARAARGRRPAAISRRRCRPRLGRSQITPRKPAPAGRRSTVVSANNGVDGNER